MSNIPRDDGAFIPLHLPKDGEELLAGRQYLIDPVARAVIYNHYGIATPKYVECLYAKSPARTVTITTTYEDGRPTKALVQKLPAVDATFRAFFKFKRVARFTLDLTVVEYQRQFYQDAPIAPEDDEDKKKPSSKQGSTSASLRKPKLEISVEELMAL